MKKITAVFLLLTAFSMIFSCAGRKSGLSSELSKKWMLTNFKDYKKEDLVKAKAYMDLSAHAKGQYGAFMGCNHIFFNAKFEKNGTAKFSDVGSTMMYCDKLMNLESQFAKELPRMTHYKIEGHFLVLSAADGEKMKFVAEDWD